METKPPVPPFTEDVARQKVRMAEDAWNTRDPDRVVLVYTPDTRWRNRAEFPVGRDEVRQFLNVKQIDFWAQKSIADDDVAMPKKKAGRDCSVASVKHHPWCF